MATRIFANRPNPDSGQQFNLFQDSSGGMSQGVVITGNDGEHLGLTANPLITQLKNETIIRYTTGAVAEASAVIASGATRLAHIRIILNPAVTTDYYAMMFDLPSVPGNTAVPMWRAFIPRGGQIDETYDPGKELVFSNGCVVCISETVNQLTLASPVAFIQTRRI